jgi:hypothetical protein
MIHAHKGFDGLHVHIDDATKRVISVVICEEKATEVLKTMVSRVWKEFKSLQSDERDNELVAETSSLISQHNEIDAEQAVQEILWKDTRAYRISITIGDEDNQRDGRDKLFTGYDRIVSGDVSRRRAETLYLSDLRSWMKRIAKKAIAATEAIEAP